MHPPQTQFVCVCVWHRDLVVREGRGGGGDKRHTPDRIESIAIG